MNLTSKTLCPQIDPALANFVYENMHVYIYIYIYIYLFIYIYIYIYILCVKHMIIYNHKPIQINRYESDQQDAMSSNRPSASQACEFDSSIQVGNIYSYMFLFVFI
jgi:hypothetical protein